MAIKKTIRGLSRRLKLDSHHAIERFGLMFTTFVLLGVLVVGASGAAALRADSDTLASTALYTTSFTTSKTDLDGEVDGVFRNQAGDRVLVVMHFGERAQISYRAADYQAFLLGSDRNLNSEPVSTPGIRGSFHVFGSTGYVGVLLDADEAFDRQVLNLTVRANAELSYKEGQQPGSADELANDASFDKHDQWRVFFNPGASGARRIAALDAAVLDPAQAYYEVALREEEKEARQALDQKLQEMRTDLAQVQSYTHDLETTKVDGLFLEPPVVPDTIDGDRVTGESAAEAEDGTSTLALETSHVVPGGFELDWRSGDVYQGYLTTLVPIGQTQSAFLTAKRAEGSDDTVQQVGSMKWIVSDGTDLVMDYQSSDVSMRPLMNVMNSLSQAYSNYAKHKAEYQVDLAFDLLRLDIRLRDVQANSTDRDDEGFLTTLR